MADVQLENGFTQIANQILEHTAKVKLSATQYRIIMVVWRYTYGFSRKMRELSISFLHQSTGCSKRQIERDLQDLFARNILIQKSVRGKTNQIGFNKNYDKWLHDKPTTDTDDGSKTVKTTDIDGGSNGATTVMDDGGLPTPTTEVLPTSMTDKKESIKEKLKEKDLDDDDKVPTPMSSERQEKGIVPTSMSFPDSERDSFNQIRSHYLNLRNYGFDITQKDTVCIQSLLDAGIPVRIIKEGITLAFERFKPDFPTHRINSFSYCKPAIEELYYRKINCERGKPYGSNATKSMGSSMGKIQKANEYVGDHAKPADTSIAKGRTGRLRRPTYL